MSKQIQSQIQREAQAKYYQFRGIGATHSVAMAGVIAFILQRTEELLAR